MFRKKPKVLKKAWPNQTTGFGLILPLVQIRKPKQLIDDPLTIKMNGDVVKQFSGRVNEEIEAVIIFKNPLDITLTNVEPNLQEVNDLEFRNWDPQN